MKVINIKVKFTDKISNDIILEIGEELKDTIYDLELLDCEDVTYEVLLNQPEIEYNKN